MNIKGPKRDFFCWVSEYDGKKKKPAICKFRLPFLLHTKGKTGFLISICDSFSKTTVLHHGTIFIELEKSQSGRETTEIKSRRLVLPSDGRSYYERKESHNTPIVSFELQNSKLYDKTNAIAVAPGSPTPFDEAAEFYMDEDKYPRSQVFNGIDLASLERQWMLLFPLTIVPGQAGIPLNVKVSPVYALECLKESEKFCKQHRVETHEEKARIFCGVLSTVLNYKNERTDDTKCAQIFGGQEDCDGMSISAAAMVNAAKTIPFKLLDAEEKKFVSFLKRKEVHLVAGIAGKTVDHNEPHMWVMLYESKHRPIFCETTSIQKEQAHFKIAAYSWTEKNCFIFCETKEKNARPVIGIMEKGIGSLDKNSKAENYPSKYLMKMPVDSSMKTNISEFCHFVLDQPDDENPGVGGRFSKYIRGSGFRDRHSSPGFGH